jgi:Fe-S-cluster containining protein
MEMKKIIQQFRRLVPRISDWHTERRAKRAFKRRQKNSTAKDVEVAVAAFSAMLISRMGEDTAQGLRQQNIETRSIEWRQRVRALAGLPPTVSHQPRMDELVTEIVFLMEHRDVLSSVFRALAERRVLFAGQAYYNAWYLSRALRARGWKADLLNWDENPSTQIYYHGEDFRVGAPGLTTAEECLNFYLESLYLYDVFHFSNANGMYFNVHAFRIFSENYQQHAEITLLKALGKVVVYSNNGCLDGVSQSAFAQWGGGTVCSICRWQNEPSVCSDEKNLAWGRFRNSIADFQCLLGGNRVDFNDDPRVHEVPEFYCLDPQVWDPALSIPDKMRFPAASPMTVRLYHAVGHKADRTRDDGVNIKSSHIYLPLIDKLKREGLPLELIEPTGIPNKEVRFLQMQADIFLDMLSYGWFGANAREAMMLAKPVICYIRPEWLESLREELPEYADELPIVSATPETIEEVLRDLIANPEKRREIGNRSRRFAIKWHSAEAAGKRFDEIYSRLLRGDPQLRHSKQ